jgi:hypothetical protein
MVSWWYTFLVSDKMLVQFCFSIPFDKVLLKTNQRLCAIWKMICDQNESLGDLRVNSLWKGNWKKGIVGELFECWTEIGEFTNCFENWKKNGLLWSSHIIHSWWIQLHRNFISKIPLTLFVPFRRSFLIAQSLTKLFYLKVTFVTTFALHHTLTSQNFPGFDPALDFFG